MELEMLPPDVTIIVNVYNGAKFVAECLDSIFALDAVASYRV